VLGNKAGQTYVNTSESGAVREISDWTVEAFQRNPKSIESLFYVQEDQRMSV